MAVVAIAQRTPEWLEARRSLVTATEVAVLLGLSPYRCEADLADEKLHGTQQAETLRMRMGTAMEPLIREAYEEATGRRLRRQHGLIVHPTIPWAGASLDFRVVGEPVVVEAKWTTSRSRFADGLPQDIQAQAVWQAAVAGVERVDVAVLTPDGLLPPFEVPADPALFADLLAVALDFRRRLAEGGPFAQSNDSLKRRYPADNGAEMVGDAELTAVVMALVALRGQRKAIEGDEERLEAAIKTRMGEIASLVGPGYRVSWKRTKDSALTDWKSLAAGLLATLPETDRDAVVGLHTTVRPGFRPLRVVLDKEATE